MPNMRSSTGKNTRSHNRNVLRKDKKHAEAVERNLRWSALSPQEQLAALNASGESAKRQRARINAKIDALMAEAKTSGAFPFSGGNN